MTRALEEENSLFRGDAAFASALSGNIALKTRLGNAQPPDARDFLHNSTTFHFRAMI